MLCVYLCLIAEYTMTNWSSKKFVEFCLLRNNRSNAHSKQQQKKPPQKTSWMHFRFSFLSYRKNFVRGMWFEWWRLSVVQANLFANTSASMHTWKKKKINKTHSNISHTNRAHSNLSVLHGNENTQTILMFKSMMAKNESKTQGTLPRNIAITEFVRRHF